MEIKYHIGSKVYIPIYWDEWTPPKQPFKITKIFIEIDKNTMNVTYQVENDFRPRHREDMCFESMEECQKWCDEHNKIERN